jgi:hypothetical protein
MKRAPLLALLVATCSVAHAGLPPRHHGEATLPAPAPVRTLDPREASTPFDRALALAFSDPLYRELDDGSLDALIADGPPVHEGSLVRVQLRQGVRVHGGRLLTADQVVASLRSATLSARTKWLFGGLAPRSEIAVDAEGRLTLRFIDERAWERVLAADSLAIVVGPSSRALAGTGPYAVRRDASGALELSAFRAATRGAPYVERVRFTAPRPPAEALRAFELGEVDVSFAGESLYGSSRRRSRELRPNGRFPVLLVPSRTGAAGSDAVFGALARAIDRRRLARAGLAPEARLGPGLEPGNTTARSPGRLTVRLAIVAGDPFEEALADALTGPLDEAGFALSVERLTVERYRAALAGHRYDLRFATVIPPLRGRGALVGAALVEAEQFGEAEALVRDGGLFDDAVAARFSPRLHAIVLGHRLESIWSRPDLELRARRGLLDFGAGFMRREAP